ncbi:MAG: DNA translocase FtsK 4TM domain-containing protein [Candidatus Latescibacteria bacterium]|nr:DNA translocase FtsK 4TM domain-containing protein [Candidatus Latescibacterota bacterium]
MQGRRAIEHRNRLVGLLFLLLAGLVVVSLLTYSANDYPNSSREAENALNAGGRAGAILSSVLFLAFGYWAYGIPVMLILSGWNRLRNHHALLLILSLMTGAVTVVSGTTASSLIEAFSLEQRFLFGGVVGIRLAQLTTAYVGPALALPLSAAVLCLFLLVGLILRRRMMAHRTSTRPLTTPIMEEEG